MADDGQDFDKKLHKSLHNSQELDRDRPEEPKETDNQTNESKSAEALALHISVSEAIELETHATLLRAQRAMSPIVKPFAYVEELRAIDSQAGSHEQLHGDSEISLSFSKAELREYVAYRQKGLADKSKYWIQRASDTLWDCTQGEISHKSMTKLREAALHKYRSVDSQSKTVSFAKAFLKHLAKRHVDQRYLSFTLFLDLPKTIKERHAVTSQIVIKEDIEKILAHISKAEENGQISSHRAQQYKGFVIFGAYTGQRSLATISKLTVGQVREVLKSDTPCIEVQPWQDKIKFSHYVPLHPQVIRAIRPLLKGRRANEPLFKYNSIVMWLKRQKIRLTRVPQNFTLASLRKWTEQYGDIIQWDPSNRAYVMSHGTSGIDWKHYKHPLPEYVYRVYMQYWADVDL
jgi:integrase